MNNLEKSSEFQDPPKYEGGVCVTASLDHSLGPTHIKDIPTSSGYEKILMSFKYPTMNERRNHIGEGCKTTFNWIFDQIEQGDNDAAIDCHVDTKSEWLPGSNQQNPNPTTHTTFRASGFLDWLRSLHQPLFWISGKPRSGKSTLVKFLLDDHRTRANFEVNLPHATIISHFFWLPGNAMDRSTKGMLCSLNHQLLSNSNNNNNYSNVFHHPTFPSIKLKDNPSDWSIKELQDIFVYLLRKSARPILIFLDGLDEIDPSDGPFFLLSLLDTVCKIPGVKVYTSSRPEPTLQQYFNMTPSFRVQDFTVRDIRNYARKRLRLQSLTSSQRLDDEEFEKLMEEFGDKSH